MDTHTTKIMLDNDNATWSACSYSPRLCSRHAHHNIGGQFRASAQLLLDFYSDMSSLLIAFEACAGSDTDQTIVPTD